MFRQALFAAVSTGLISPCCVAQSHSDPLRHRPVADVLQTAKQWRLDHSTFNPAVMPCDDFYEHVCGGWDVPGRIPADQSKADWASDAAGKTNDALIGQLLTGNLPGGN